MLNSAQQTELISQIVNSNQLNTFFFYKTLLTLYLSCTYTIENTVLKSV